MNEIYKIENLSFVYPETSWKLKELSFSIAAGEVVGFIGPNGSGKSTLIKLMSGILKPDEGKIILADKTISSIPRKELAKIVGYLPQHIQGEYDFTVSEIVAMGRYPYSKGMGFLNGKDDIVIEKCLEITETKGLSDRVMSQLSGGERQRVFLASVLAQEPSVLVLDEPTTGLDLHHQLEFLTLLKSLALKRVSVVFATHEINLAAIFCKRLLLFKQGKLICDDKPNEVITNKRMKEIFGDKIEITIHPNTGLPFVLPTT